MTGDAELKQLATSSWQAQPPARAHRQHPAEPVRNFVCDRAVEHCAAMALMKRSPEDDGEPCLGHGPLTGRHFPLFLHRVQDQAK